MIETDDEQLTALLADPKLRELPATLSNELERSVGADVLCGSDPKLDEILEEAAQECDDLGDRLLVKISGDILPSGLDRTASDDPRNVYSSMARTCEAASRAFAKEGRTDSGLYWSQVRCGLAVGLRNLGVMNEDSVASQRLLMRAVEVAEELVQATRKNAAPENQANALAILAETYGRLAIRTEPDPETQSLLERSVEVWEDSIRAITKRDAPDFWSRHQTALAVALMRLCSMADAADRGALLARAGNAQEAGIETMDRKSDTMDWIRAHERLGAIRAVQADRETGGTSLRFRGAALKSLKTALRDISRDEQPKFWADTQATLGSLLVSQARSGAKESSELFQSAVKAYEKALQATSREKYPFEFASHNSKLGELLLEQAHMIKGKKKARNLLERARECLETAMQDLGAPESSGFWASTHFCLAKTLSTLAQHCPEDSDLTIGHYRRSVEVGDKLLNFLDENGFQDEQISIRVFLGTTVAELASHVINTPDMGDARELFERAQELYEGALKRCTGNARARAGEVWNSMMYLRDYLMDVKSKMDETKRDYENRRTLH